METYFQKLSYIFFNSKFDNIPLSHVRSTDTLLFFFIRKSNFGPKVELSSFFLLQFEPYTVLNVFLKLCDIIIFQYINLKNILKFLS